MATPKKREPKRAGPKGRTSTSNFGVGKRESHDASAFYERFEAPVITDAGFRERNGGEWQGHTGTEIDERWPGMRDAWRRGELTAPPGGEHDVDVLERFDAALKRALARAGSGIVGVVTHHGMLGIVARRAGVDGHALIPNLGGFWFDVVNGTLANAEPLE